MQGTPIKRTYSSAVVALAVGAPPKWVDNLLSQHDVLGVHGGTQGLARRIDNTGLVTIAIVRMLHADIGTSVAQAVSVARQVMTHPHESSVTLSPVPGLSMTFDRTAIGRHVRERVVAAMESAAQIARGRPRRSADAM